MTEAGKNTQEEKSKPPKQQIINTILFGLVCIGTIIYSFNSAGPLFLTAVVILLLLTITYLISILKGTEQYMNQYVLIILVICTLAYSISQGRFKRFISMDWLATPILLCIIPLFSFITIMNIINIVKNKKKQSDITSVDEQNSKSSRC